MSIANEYESDSMLQTLDQLGWFGHQSREQDHIAFVKVDGKTQQPADIGMKVLFSDNVACCRKNF